MVINENKMSKSRHQPSCGLFLFSRPCSLVLGILLLAAITGRTNSFSMSISSSKTIYDIPNSGWKAPQWNWGYAVGTGHDCAAVCRDRYYSRKARLALIQELCAAPTRNPEHREPRNFEEVKLVLALAWQRGRWDGTDGGRGGYGEVLGAMAKATRYESDNEKENANRLVADMTSRYHLLSPTKEQEEEMRTISTLLETDFDAARRKCSGLVLLAMKFVENGL